MEFPMQKNYFLFGCLIFIVLAVIAFFIGLNLPMRKVSSYSMPAKSDSWLLLNPSGVVTDYSEVEYGFMGKNQSVADICAKLRAAATDKNVKGILIRPVFSQLGMSGLDEIAEALKEFKKSGKPVLAHLEMQSQKDYLLAALADTISMEPASSAGIFMDGVMTNVSFYKGLLDKLGLKVNVIRSGEFKGYGETYSRKDLSEETYSNLKELLSDRYELLISYIASQRKLSPDKVKAVFEQRPDYLVTAEYAKQAGLVDVVSGRDEFLKSHSIERKQLLDMQDYTPKPVSVNTRDKIAVCYLQGGITISSVSQYQDGITAAKVQKMVDALNEDSRIKAVVFRVNSPGGSALESEIIYRKLEMLKSKMPVVISMSGTAASGGYYISAPANYIVADPYTVTGSIGVIQLLPDASELSKKAGITNQTIGFGKYAGAMNFMNPPSQDLLASLQRNSENVYSEFKHRVAKYRKVDYDSLENLAGGRVWSAQDALANRLVDKIGTLDTAIKKAAELAKLSAYQTVVLPEKKQYFELFMEQLKNLPTAKAAFTPDSYLDLLAEQFKAIFKPYTALCLMPFELES